MSRGIIYKPFSVLFSVELCTPPVLHSQIICTQYYNLNCVVSSFIFLLQTCKTNAFVFCRIFLPSEFFVLRCENIVVVIGAAGIIRALVDARRDATPKERLDGDRGHRPHDVIGGNARCCRKRRLDARDLEHPFGGRRAVVKGQRDKFEELFARLVDRFDRSRVIHAYQRDDLYTVRHRVPRRD